MRRRDVLAPWLSPMACTCGVGVCIARGQWLPAAAWLLNAALFTWIALRQAAP